MDSLVFRLNNTKPFELTSFSRESLTNNTLPAGIENGISVGVVV
jgi:hypothetical protein